MPAEGRWVTRGVVVNSSAFLACHQCWSAGSSLGWGWNFRLFYVAFSEARRQGFSPGTPVFFPPSSGNGFSQEKKAKVNAISTLSNLVAELLFVPRGTRHVARDKRPMCCT